MVMEKDSGGGGEAIEKLRRMTSFVIHNRSLMTLYDDKT